MKLGSKRSLARKCLIYGFGINDANYILRIVKNKKTIWRCPFYTKWEHMLARCYYPPYHKQYPTYIGCSVCPEWRYFSKFRLWMENQKWEGLELDKDLLVKGNKVYGPDTCCFIPKSINYLFGFKKKKNNLHLPEGVCLTASGKYRVEINIRPNKRYQKTISTFKEACICALEKKIEAVEYRIISYPEMDIRVVFALNREINGFQEKINIIQNSSPNLFDIA
jgi:hypothetical protein